MCAQFREREPDCERRIIMTKNQQSYFEKQHLKIRNNLTFEQRIALKELSQSTENKVYSYDKGTVFVTVKNKDAIRKIEEQIRESVVSNTDSTSAVTSKIQKHLANLGKQQKFETRTYSRLYGVIKPTNVKNFIPCEL